MSSIVTEVLQSSGKLAKENIVLKVNDLKRKLEIIKLEVQQTLNHQYVDFFPQYVKLNKFLAQLNQFTKDYEHLHIQIEKEVKPQMVNSVAEFHDVLEDLKKTKALKAAVWNLVVLHQHLEGAKDFKSQSAYYSAAHVLIEFETTYKEIDSDLKDIAILNTLKNEFYITREGTIYDIEQLWKKSVVISNHTEGKNKKKVTLSISKGMYGCEELFKALYLLNYLRPVLREFGKQFLKLVCEVLILNNVKISVNEMTSTLTIDIRSEHSPQPHEVFEQLTKVFQFLFNELFALLVTDEDTEVTCMNEFGAVTSEDFYSLIIEKCLKEAVPKQSSQLEAFHTEIVAAENFCNDLQTMGFSASSDNSLLNFIKNVDILPVNKMAQDILSRARSLMTKSLHQTVTYGVECMQTVEVEDSHDMNDMTRSKGALSKSTFLFPRCQISVSMKELVKLLKEVKDEAKSIGSTHAPRLYYVARSICELYCCVVPTFHKEEIKNIPQQTAIFHNNCMYLAHEICILGSHYERDLQAPIPMTFTDLVPEIKKLGTEAFLCQMRHQRQQLLQLIQEEQAYQTVMMDEDLVNKAEKSIRQCLCQLQFLQKVWSNVLPSDVYFKAIGTLFNTCLEEIILRVLSMEDISADAAAQMDSIFSILLKQGPDVFKIQNIDKRNSVHLYVKRWFKFQELQLILSASMREIVDRWSSGKGPLATHFNADDVKHLIRALFQNTERRAAALAKIR